MHFEFIIGLANTHHLFLKYCVVSKFHEKTQFQLKMDGPVVALSVWPKADFFKFLCAKELHC